MPTDPAPFAGPLAVTLAYVVLYYGFMIHQARVKIGLAKGYAARGEKFDRYFTPDREMLAADRLLLNTLEHMPPFLLLLWLNAVFVGTRSATIAGCLYLASRVGYPLLLGARLGRSIRPRILGATVIGYLVITYYVAALGYALVSG